MKLLLHSDLHTELSPCQIEHLDIADILVLAGDIGDLHSTETFFAYLRRLNPALPILFILGNHEYFGHDFDDVVPLYQSLCTNYQIHLLDNAGYSQSDILFLGTTLWSNFQLAGQIEKSMAWAQEHTGDCRFITKKEHGVTQKLTSHDILAQFNQSYAFLQCELIKAQGHYRKIVVVSHFVPSRELIAPVYRRNQTALMQSSYWNNDLPELFKYVDYWCYGHSHNNINLRLGRTQFISNQRGYSQLASRADNPQYQSDFLLPLQ